MKHLTSILLLSSILFVGCAPMPSKTQLYKGMSKPTEISEIEDYKEFPQSFWMTTFTCYKVTYRKHPIRNTIALAMLSPVLGCASIQLKDGKVHKCHIYYSAGDAYTRNHEREHCKGHPDAWY